MKPDYEFDVAFSFAGEDRQYVEKVAGFLISKHVKVFYDKYKAAELWGKNLYTHLSAIYKDKAKHTIIFISKHYPTKSWTNHERENAQARAFKENYDYLLIARFDATEIPGVLDTTGIINLAEYTPKYFHY